MWSVWLSVDPLAEQMPEWSSYNYTFSNPIKFTDPTGMAPEGSIDPPKWLKKLYRAMKESFSRGHAHKSRVKTFKRDMNSLAKYSGFMDGTGPRDKLEEGISIKTDKPTNGGMVSVSFSDRNADVKIIDESIISAATGLTGKVNGNPKSFIDHVETVVNIAGKGQRFSESRVKDKVGDYIKIKYRRVTGYGEIRLGNYLVGQKLLDTTVPETDASSVRQTLLNRFRENRRKIIDSIKQNR